MFNNYDMDWYIRMPTDKPPVDPKVEKQPELCEEEGTTLKPPLPVRDSQLSTLRWVGMYAGIRVIPFLLATFKMWQASLEERDVPP